MLPPVCCLLFPPALAEESRWMQQLFETALHSWWQWPSQGGARYSSKVSHSLYSLLFSLWCWMKLLFVVWLINCRWSVLFIRRRCLHKCVLRHMELPSAASVGPGSKGRTRGHRYLQCSSLCLRGTKRKNLSKQHLYGVDIWDIPFLNTNQILKIPARSF